MSSDMAAPALGLIVGITLFLMFRGYTGILVGVVMALIVCKKADEVMKNANVQKNR